MNYFFYIIFALAPSVIWLLFFLRKDVHPESNRMVLIVFFLGILAAIPAALIEKSFSDILKNLNLSPFLFSILSVFLGVAFVEEIFKYLVVRVKVLSDPELDEPLDVILYMIIAALGLAVTENILILFPISNISQFNFFETLSISALRFIGATFLHALCSGSLGFFMALSFFESEKRLKLLVMGFTLVVLLHGFYNFSIMQIEGNLRFVIPSLILVSLAIFVFLGFQKLKKLKSICKIK